MKNLLSIIFALGIIFNANSQSQPLGIGTTKANVVKSNYDTSFVHSEVNDLKAVTITATGSITGSLTGHASQDLIVTSNLSDVQSKIKSLQNIGGAYSKVVPLNISTTIDSSFRGQLLDVTTSTGTVVITLGSTCQVNGFAIFIRKADAASGTVTVSPAPGNGAPLIGTQGHTFLVWHDGTQYNQRCFVGSINSLGDYVLSSKRNVSITAGTGDTIKFTGLITSTNFNSDSINSNKLNIGISDTIVYQKKAVLFGTSISVGALTKNIINSYASLYASRSGVALINKAQAGTTMVNANQYSMVNRVNEIPTYASGYKYLIFEYGANDANNGAGTYDSTVFKTAYGSVIDTATIKRGWSASNIILVVTYTTNIKNLLVNKTIKNLAATKGCKFVDGYTPMKVAGTSTTLSADSVHPTNAGHILVANAFLSVTSESYKKYSAINNGLAVSGNLTIGGTLQGGIYPNQTGKSSPLQVGSRFETLQELHAYDVISADSTIKIGNQSGLVQKVKPIGLILSNEYGSSPTANLKLKLAGNSDTYGIQISNGAVNYVSNGGTHNFYNVTSSPSYSISNLGQHTYTGQSLSSGSNPFVTYTQAANTGGTANGFKWTAGAHTGQTASTPVTDILFDLSSTVTYAPGSIATQYGVKILPRVYAFTGASTISDASALEVTGAPSQGSLATITRPWAARFLGNTYATTLMVGNQGVAPGANIHIQGGSNTNQLIECTGSSSRATLNLKNDAGNIFQIYMNGSTASSFAGNAVMNNSAIKDLLYTVTGVQYTRVTSAGKFIVGPQIGASAYLDVRGTTEQMRLQYDTSNYWKSVTSSTGVTTWTAAGSATPPRFVMASPLSLSLGSVTAPAWGISGVGFKIPAATYTDNTSSGTVASSAINYIGQPTVSTPSATTYTNSYNTYIDGIPLVAGSAAQTNGYALGVNGAVNILNGSVNLAGSLNLSGATRFFGTIDNNILNILTNNSTRISIAASGNTYIGGSSAANSTLQIGGGESHNYTAVSTTYSVLATDYVINCTTGSFTVTLPTAVGITGRVYIIKNTGGGTITLATTSSQTIDGSAPGTVTNSTMLQSNGANWVVLAKY